MSYDAAAEKEKNVIGARIAAARKRKKIILRLLRRC